MGELFTWRVRIKWLNRVQYNPDTRTYEVVHGADTVQQIGQVTGLGNWIQIDLL